MLVGLDIAVGLVLLVVLILLGYVILDSAAQYGTLQDTCGAGPYTGLQCNSAVLGAVVLGLTVVAVLGFFAGLGFFAVNVLRRHYAFFWPLAAIVLVVVLFYVGTWLVGQTTP